MPSGVGFLLSSSTASTPACPLRQHSRKSRLAAPKRAITTCQQKREGGDPPAGLILDRRDVLLALGGAAASNLGVRKERAVASPVAPDLTQCRTATAPGVDAEYLKCCPPFLGTDPVDYDFPATPLRVRRPAHLVKSDEEYMSKYEEATRKMKALPVDHPWNFYQQAHVHCAYCNDGYYQKDSNKVNMQVHFSWFFFPFHRFYLHFYERILGKLIDDDTFALPYWNFDTEAGMSIPEIFTDDTSSPLYNPKRNTNNYHPAILDYKYDYKTSNRLPDKDLVRDNLSYMQKTFKQSLQTPELFMGDTMRGGEVGDEAGTGGLEAIHNVVHQWVGTDKAPYTDMGDFSTAGRDSVFYCLHANVDRLWHLYRNFRGNRLEFDDKDWLDSSWVFCDENQRVVRVKVRDSLDMNKLRYAYEEVPLPWLGKVATRKPAETKEKSLRELALVRVAEFGDQPRALGTTDPLRVLVARPKKSRSKAEKEDKVEVLQVKGIEVTTPGPARFDVYVARPYGELAGPDLGDFAGSFVKLPHRASSSADADGAPKRAVKKKSLKLNLTPILEDIEAEDAEKLVVSIVPRVGEITVGAVVIKLVQTDGPRLL